LCAKRGGVVNAAKCYTCLYLKNVYERIALSLLLVTHLYANYVFLNPGLLTKSTVPLIDLVLSKSENINTSVEKLNSSVEKLGISGEKLE